MPYDETPTPKQQETAATVTGRYRGHAARAEDPLDKVRRLRAIDRAVDADFAGIKKRYRAGLAAHQDLSTAKAYAETANRATAITTALATAPDPSKPQDPQLQKVFDALCQQFANAVQIDPNKPDFSDLQRKVYSAYNEIISTVEQGTNALIKAALEKFHADLAFASSEGQRQVILDSIPEVFEQIHKAVQEQTEDLLLQFRNVLNYGYGDFQGFAQLTANHPYSDACREMVNAIDAELDKLDTNTTELMDGIAGWITEHTSQVYRLILDLETSYSKKNPAIFANALAAIERLNPTDPDLIAAIHTAQEAYRARKSGAFNMSVRQIFDRLSGDNFIPEAIANNKQLFDSQLATDIPQAFAAGNAMFDEEVQLQKAQLAIAFEEALKNRIGTITHILSSAQPDDQKKEALEKVYEEVAKAAYDNQKFQMYLHWDQVAAAAKQDAAQQFEKAKEERRQYYIQRRILPLTQKKDSAGNIIISTGSDGEPLKLEPGKEYKVTKNGKMTLKVNEDGTFEFNRSFSNLSRHQIPVWQVAMFSLNPIALAGRWAVNRGLGVADWARNRSAYNEVAEEMDMIAAFADGPVTVTCPDPVQEAQMIRELELRGVWVVGGSSEFSWNHSPFAKDMHIGLSTKEKAVAAAKIAGLGLVAGAAVTAAVLFPPAAPLLGPLAAKAGLGLMGTVASVATAAAHSGSAAVGAMGIPMATPAAVAGANALPFAGAAAGALYSAGERVAGLTGKGKKRSTSEAQQGQNAPGRSEATHKKHARGYHEAIKGALGIDPDVPPDPSAIVRPHK